MFFMLRNRQDSIIMRSNNNAFHLKVFFLPIIVLFSVKSIVSDWFENFVCVAPPGSYSSGVSCLVPSDSSSSVNFISHEDISVFQCSRKIALAVDNFLALCPVLFQIFQMLKLPSFLCEVLPNPLRFAARDCSLSFSLTLFAYCGA